MGEAKTLVEWSEVVHYFQLLAEASDQVRVTELGRSTEDRPFILVTIADSETLADLPRYQRMQAQFADPRNVNDEEAESLVEQGKTVS